MKYKVSFKYHYFVEQFEVDLFKNKLTYELINIIPFASNSSKQDINGIFLDFSKLETYQNLKFNEGDLLLLQYPKFLLVGSFQQGNLNWHKIKLNDIIVYILDAKLPFFCDNNNLKDIDLFINAFLSDFIRNDFSSSEFNKKVKFFKIAGICSYVSNVLNLNLNIKRVIFDQTLLGEVEIKDIALSIRFLNQELVSTYKISNNDKIIWALTNKGILDANFVLNTSCFVINKPNSYVVNFINSKHKLMYQLNKNENYLFDIGDEIYEMVFNHEVYYDNITGLVYLYNGNVYDLLIQDAEET